MSSSTTSVKTYAAYAFDSLYSSLHKVPAIPISKFKAIIDNDCKLITEKCPLFVTWNTKKNNEKILRGCIGNFGDLLLPDGVKEYSLIAAFEDTRFEPIKLKELPKLSCSVTLLKNFEIRSDPLDWELGKHGIRIIINGKRSATFLPEVAEEQGWSKEETLQHLVRKAGYYSGDWKDMSIELTRYQGIKDSIDYQEYLDLRSSIKE
ncbi:hypothetical protein CANARDRAFT_29624 [[Candida] arabinofermentans NRRL YB-2248]|uniref:AMMECR1 domain-containing protein n=1 Tax=[Candida] arabinofermentans NRRL YB-2248 TaxID=983967 RepID=A0A1E4SWM2_9ASCO|nr:hypothetical protein CANARDRAFT_29624 [[Candida] arabinofermentans NRRL YB-2248]